MIVTIPSHIHQPSWTFGLSGYIATVPKPRPESKYCTRVLTELGEEVSVVVTQQGPNIIIKSLVPLDNHELIIRE